VDDIVVMSDSFEQHIQNLQEVFQALRRYQIRVNPDKCAFGVEGRKFLGFILTHRGIKVNLEKCKEITEMRSPMVGGKCTCEVSEGPRQYLYLLVSGYVSVTFLQSPSFNVNARSAGGTCDCTSTLKSMFRFKCAILGYENVPSSFV